MLPAKMHLKIGTSQKWSTEIGSTTQITHHEKKSRERIDFKIYVAFLRINILRFALVFSFSLVLSFQKLYMV